MKLKRRESGLIAPDAPVDLASLPFAERLGAWLAMQPEWQNILRFPRPQRRQAMQAVARAILAHPSPSQRVRLNRDADRSKYEADGSRKEQA